MREILRVVMPAFVERLQRIHAHAVVRLALVDLRSETRSIKFVVGTGSEARAQLRPAQRYVPYPKLVKKTVEFGIDRETGTTEPAVGGVYLI